LFIVKILETKLEDVVIRGEAANPAILNIADSSIGVLL